MFKYIYILGQFMIAFSFLVVPLKLGGINSQIILFLAGIVIYTFGRILNKNSKK
jgi:uncharacterized membrane protein YjjP (DUF1212 family)